MNKTTTLITKQSIQAELKNLHICYDYLDNRPSRGDIRIKSEGTAEDNPHLVNWAKEKGYAVKTLKGTDGFGIYQRLTVWTYVTINTAVDKLWLERKQRMQKATACSLSPENLQRQDVEERLTKSVVNPLKLCLRKDSKTGDFVASCNEDKEVRLASEITENEKEDLRKEYKEKMEKAGYAKDEYSLRILVKEDWVGKYLHAYGTPYIPKFRLVASIRIKNKKKA